MWLWFVLGSAVFAALASILAKIGIGGVNTSLLRRKTTPAIPYDPETQEPAVRSSICTGEMTVGFIDRKTGKFREYELARGQGDVDAFCKHVGVEPKDIKRVY